MTGVGDQHLDAPLKRAVGRGEADRAHVDVHVVGNDLGDGVDEAYVVDAGEVEADLELFGGARRPLGLHRAVGVLGKEVGGVGAVLAVDLDAAAHHHKPKHLVAGDGVAATREAVIDFLETLANEEHVSFFRR